MASTLIFSYSSSGYLFRTVYLLIGIVDEHAVRKGIVYLFLLSNQLQNLFLSVEIHLSLFELREIVSIYWDEGEDMAHSDLLSERIIFEIAI